MGRSTRGYDSYFIDELCNHFDELPKTEKCIRSQLTKENILKAKKDEALAKQLLKMAKLRKNG